MGEKQFTKDIDLSKISAGNLAMDIAQQSIGNLTTDIANQSIGNLNMDVANQTVQELIQRPKQGVPNSASFSYLFDKDNDSETKIVVNISGRGILYWVKVHGDDAGNTGKINTTLEIDGNEIFSQRYEDLNNDGYGPTTPNIQLTTYSLNGTCNLQYTKSHSFESSITLTLIDPTFSQIDHPTSGRVVYALL